MKTISRALIMCAAITAMSNTYADAESGLGERMNMPSIPSDNPSTQETKKTLYPMIEQYAPDTIKEVCQKPSGTICHECQAAERFLSCAKQIAKTPDLTKNLELDYYCQKYRCGNQELVIKIVDAIAHKANLNNDEAFALLKEFNRAVVQAQKDGDRERAKYEYDLTHPN